MAITCPHCGAAENHTKEFRRKQILSLPHYVLGIITGFIGVLIWYFSLMSTFECDKCNQTFFVRTPAAQVFRVIFHIMILVLDGSGWRGYLHSCVFEMTTASNNIPAAGKAEIARLFAFVHPRLGLPEPGR